MDEFVSMIFQTAYAQSAEAAGQGGFASLLPLVLIIVVFYFLLIRPQQKKAKQHREMISKLAVGDEVITASGILGKVAAINENVVVIDLGDSKVRFQLQAVQAILPKGTLQ